MQSNSGEATVAAADKGHQDEAVLRFVERFALILVESGMPRMPSRVFAYVLADDSQRYTARELGKRVTGRELEAEPLLRHLRAKAAELYGI